MSNDKNSVVEIAGAGPAGLAAAITLARAGRSVIVHESQADVGWRFKRDLQGLENWTTRQDVLAVLNDSGITTDFECLPCTNGVTFDAWGQARAITSTEPIFYLVERGPNAGSLDHALLEQARQLGVEVRFNSRVKQLSYPAILATGPKAADAIAVGYHFETDMANGYWVICDNDLAPGGYAYLLIWNGNGTVKSCMFSGFKQEKQLVEKTVSRFKELVGLEMQNPVSHGGAGNFYLPISATAGKRPVVGEQAGFQDTLWGFGMRHAIHSGILAAKSILEETNYDALWQSRFGSMLKVSTVNRALYSLLNNHGYKGFLRYVSRHNKDVRNFLHKQYNPTFFKSLLYPWASRRVKSLRADVACNHLDCDCVWCRMGDEH